MERPYDPPRAASRADRVATDGYGAFDRDKFLLRQRALTISEKYEVWDEQGQPILFVERPAHALRNLGALGAGLAAGAVVGGGLVALSDALQSGAIAAVGVVAGLAAFLVVFVALQKKRNIYFYRDDGKTEKLLEVVQDQKVAFLKHTYTVNDADGRTLALFSKNLLTDIFRKRWHCTSPDGTPLWLAQEDSVVLAILRRFIGLIPLNFVFEPPGGGPQLGQFNRKLTLLDRYVLDLSPDVGRVLDRRVALAMGVMLDTGERR